MTAFTGNNSLIQSSEQLGAFSGYVRRPQPNQNGMIAQIFGENGSDADTILALSLTKFQDIQVNVNIYLIKDSSGALMKQQDGKYPLIAKFLGIIRRSQPKKDGMIAHIFAPNGVHADHVSNLSKSDYQDALVFVDIRGINSILKQVESENTSIIDEQYANKLTKNEKQEILKNEKKFRKINEILETSNFFNKIEVITSLGNNQEYKQWLEENKTCTHLQDEPCELNSTTVEVNGLLKPFNYLPCCAEHSKLFTSLTNEHFLKNKFYYEVKHGLLLKQWAIETFKSKLCKNNSKEPNPLEVIDWCHSKKLTHLLPTNYKNHKLLFAS